MESFSLFQSKLSWVLAGLGIFFALDPLRVLPLSRIDFQPVEVLLGPPGDLYSLHEPEERLRGAQVMYEGEIFGPESIAFDLQGRGPYTGLSDGRVVRRLENDSGWETVATLSPSWDPDRCAYKPALPARPNEVLEHVCGRPLGLCFHPRAGDLLAADAYFGLFRIPNVAPHPASAGTDDVEPDLAADVAPAAPASAWSAAARPFVPGKPQLLVNQFGGAPLKFLNDLDVDPSGAEGSGGGGVVYFTQTSQKYDRRQFLECTLEGGRDGRLLQYDLGSGALSVLLQGLVFPNGVSLSHEGSFLAFCESTRMMCRRLWLRGPSAGTTELLAHLPGFPDNIRRSPRGGFWVAVHKRRNWVIEFLAARPRLRAFLLLLLPDLRLVYLLSLGQPPGIALELDSNGTVTDVLTDNQGSRVRAISQVSEHAGSLWFGSVLSAHVGRLDYP